MHKWLFEWTVNPDEVHNNDGDKKGHKKGECKRTMHPKQTGAPADHIKHVSDDRRHMTQDISSKGCS